MFLDEEVSIFDTYITKNTDSGSEIFSVHIENMCVEVSEADFGIDRHIEPFKKVVQSFINNKVHEFENELNELSIVELMYSNSALIHVRDTKTGLYVESSEEVHFDISEINTILKWYCPYLEGSQCTGIIASCFVKNNELVGFEIFYTVDSVPLVNERVYDICYEIEDGNLIYKGMMFPYQVISSPDELEKRMDDFSKRYEIDITDDVLLELEEIINSNISNKDFSSVDGELKIKLKIGKDFFGNNSMNTEMHKLDNI